MVLGESNSLVPVYRLWRSASIDELRQSRYTNRMINHLSGTIIDIAEKHITLDVRGVGYKVHLSPGRLATLYIETEVSLWTHLAVRETALDLFGFVEPTELRFFEMLVAVSGIGPRSALGILDMGSVASLQEAIVAGDIGYLTKVSGIGKKTAEKIVLELREKLGTIVDNTVQRPVDSEVLEALEALGYSREQSRDAIKALPDDITNINERITAALKNIR